MQISLLTKQSVEITGNNSYPFISYRNIYLESKNCLLLKRNIYKILIAVADVFNTPMSYEDFKELWLKSQILHTAAWTYIV